VRQERTRLVAALAILAGLASQGMAGAAGTASAAKTAAATADAKAKDDPYAPLSYRFIGPPGNRTSAVVGVPGDPNTYYVGAASGGVWKSSDGGAHWKPVFDDQPAQSIGAIAIAPSDPNVVWVGTGEPFIRSNVSLGNGVYRSTDAGKTWTHVGLEKTGRIARVVVDPRDPDVAFVAALGTCYGPQPERGVYRTKDGGRSWERVLFVDEGTGASDLSMDATNPRILFAGMWPIDIKTWGRKSGGSGGGVYVSRDFGNTWKQVKGHGLPEPPIGKVAVAVAPSNPERVYALMETGQRGSLWRSDDGGEKWRRVNASRLLNERPHYYTRMLVMPDNANEVYFPSNGMGATWDGGETAEPIRWGGDNHDMWADPLDPRRMMIGNDGGVYISTTRGRQWAFTRLPIGQIYHVTTDDRVPYMVYGQMQDDGSMRGPSNSRSGGSRIHPALWTSTAGCETGWNTPDPVDPDIVWGGCYAGVVERFDARTGMSRSVSVWPERTMGAPAKDVKLRMNWTFPLAISPHDHDTVYVGSQYVHATSDGGVTWRTISPDLTLNDPTMMGDSGGLTIDNLSVEYAGVVFSIAESPIEKGVIWAGTNDGNVQVTRDGGEHWTNVTPNIPGLPPKGNVNSVDPSRFDAGTCYIAVDLHQVDNRDPFLYKTTDYGKTWTSIGAGIEKSPLSYAHVVRENPHRKGMLFAGTENGLHVSFDDGRRWEPLQSKLPHAPVYWLTVQERFHDLVVGTYGRGFYILDDLSGLEQLTEAVRFSDAHLFSPRKAYRFRSVAQPNLAPMGAAAGTNPPYGASIEYWLKAKVEDPADAAAKADAPGTTAPRRSEAEREEREREKAKRNLVEMTITDAAGETVRTLRGTNRMGVNRVTWDLRHEPTLAMRLRTTPDENPHLMEEKRFRGRSHRGVFYYGIRETKRGPLVPPGTYTVKLAVNGKPVASQSLLVEKDPNSAGTEADIAAATRLSLAIYRDTNAVVRMVNQIEWTRKQLEELRAMLKARKADPADLDAAAALEASVLAVEDRLLQRTLAEADEKSFRGPLQLYLTLLWLQAEVGAGAADVSGAADFAPTRSEEEVYERLAKRLEEVRHDFDELYRTRIPAFNEAVKAKGLLQLMTVTEPDEREPEPEADDDDEDGQDG
jgi:photosystem II stability/assembly factor-like uncharacterized protein